MSTTFLKLMEGSRLSNYMGLKMSPGFKFTNGQGYMYIEIPLLQVEMDGQPQVGIKRNQQVFLVPACTVEVKGNQVIEIEPNIELAELGTVQASYKIHPQSGLKRPGVWFTPRRDTDLSELTYLIRIYMYE